VWDPSSPELFNAHEVDYLVVGSFALAFHGIPRYAADLDLLIRPSPQNAKRILRTLSQFGFGHLPIEASDLQAADNIIQLG
jgi:hypothetical protein